MNASTLEPRRSEHSWDIDTGTTSHDWACWIPGRHHDALTRPATGPDGFAEPDEATQRLAPMPSVA